MTAPSPAAVERVARAAATAMRNGDPVPDEIWDGPSEEDAFLTRECRKIATAALAAYHAQLEAEGLEISSATELSALRSVASDIREIMREYREQEDTDYVDTPGGLEHMGDVWRKLQEWDKAIAAAPGRSEPT